MAHSKAADSSKPQSVSDDDLDQVVGGAPLPYPDTGSSGGGGGGLKKVKAASKSTSAESSGGDQAGSDKAADSSGVGKVVNNPLGSPNVKYEGSVGITGVPDTGVD